MKTINTSNISFRFGDKPGQEKVSFWIGEEGLHYTLIFHGSSNMVDIHKTYDKKGQKRRHEPILKVTNYKFRKFMVLIHNANLLLLSKLWSSKWSVKASKLKHHNLILIPMEIPETSASQFVVTKRKMTKVKKQINTEEIIQLFIFPEDIINHDGQSFFAFKERGFKQKGWILKSDKSNHSKELYFLSSERINNYFKQLNIAVEHTIQKL